MAPLVLLVVSFGIASWVLRWVRGEWCHGPAGRVAAAAMFLFTGVSHFVFPIEMAAMVPSAFPAPRLWVLATGVAEILGGLGLLVTGTSRLSAVCLAVLLVAVFPANVFAAIHKVGVGGHLEGIRYLWFRAPLQVVFLAWVVYFGIFAAGRTRNVSGSDN
jgi:uncharacterized membrane protein